MIKRHLPGRPRTSPLSRAEQLRAAKRKQRARQRAAGQRQIEIAIPTDNTERFRAAVASPHFRREFERLIGEMTVDRTAWPTLKGLTWNRADRWIPANEALALYERNWRHVDVARITPGEEKLIERLTARFGGGVFGG